MASLRIYEAMWRNYATWVAPTMMEPGGLTVDTLSRFIRAQEATGAATPRYVWRLVQIIDRVTEAHCKARKLAKPTACHDYLERYPSIRYANASQRDHLPECLSTAEHARLLRMLRQPLTPDSTWQDARNRAAMALHIGTGITPAELRALTMPDLIVASEPAMGRAQAHLRIAGDGTQPGHRVAVTGWALRTCQQWLQQRDTLAIPGNVMFPSTRGSGKTWGKVAHYNAMTALFSQAGLEHHAGASYRLRHSYALRLLQKQQPPVEIALQLGVKDPKVMERYIALHELQQDQSSGLA
ncbi:tyrosine-type recombinase/integrase [Ideonella sp.]|uniref:tyrosine-type recombinase/integrase n=1 Tax=Ideonella sp. TaxID=1929293 RepID=UPI003BB7C439